MKHFKLLVTSLLLSFSTTALATQLCPAQVTVSYGHFEVPAGFTVTHNTVDTSNPIIVKDKDYPLAFSGAMYNYQFRVTPNNNRISCEYTSNDQNYMYAIELTTTETNLPPPNLTGTSWTKYNLTPPVLFCGFPFYTPVSAPSSCPWD